MLRYAKSEIEKSNKWYDSVYDDDRNSYRKYPIRYLKRYVDWLNNELGINETPQNTLVVAPSIKEIQKVKPLKSFFYNGLNKRSTLSKLQEALIKIDKVADTTVPVFRNAFLGIKIDNRKSKINWTGTIPELKHFINSLIECHKINEPKNKWQITSQLFQHPAKGDYTVEQLTHNTKRVSEKHRKLIDEILSNI
jgi:hypothetical protein